MELHRATALEYIDGTLEYLDLMPANEVPTPD